MGVHSLAINSIPLVFVLAARPSTKAAVELCEHRLGCNSKINWDMDTGVVCSSRSNRFTRGQRDWWLLIRPPTMKAVRLLVVGDGSRMVSHRQTGRITTWVLTSGSFSALNSSDGSQNNLFSKKHCYHNFLLLSTVSQEQSPTPPFHLHCIALLKMAEKTCEMSCFRSEDNFI